MRILKVIAAASVALAMAACQTTKSPPPKPVGELMKEAELATIYMAGEETTHVGTSAETGSEWEIVRDGAGAQTIHVTTNGFRDTGAYRIDGDTICSSWKKIRDGREACSSIYKLENGAFTAWQDGKKTADFKRM